MPSDVVVLRADDRRCPWLARDGWRAPARSWAACLHIRPELTEAWTAAVARLPEGHTCRPLREVDVPSVLALDASTAGDYPGSVATADEALTAQAATPTARRRSFGVFDPDGQLVAMTFLDIDGQLAEVDFTVVSRDRRRQGLAAAVKAASLLSLQRAGVTLVRSGGSDENHAILGATRSLGFRVDEHGVTMTAPTN